MKTAIALIGLFVAIFCGVGLAMGYFGVSRLIQGDINQGSLLLFGAIAFGGFGAFVLALTIVGTRRKAREDARQSAHPDEPWLWRGDWAEGQVRSSTKSAAWFLWGFAVLWNSISTPLAVFLPEEILDKHNYAASLGLLFPLVGIGIIIAAIRKSIQQYKFGNCLFRMDRVPGVLGGEVSGAIVARGEIVSDAGVTIQLSCINSVRSGSGKNSSTTEHVLWQQEQSGVQPSPGPGGARSVLPVRFRTPCDARPTDSSNPDNSILWRLAAQAAVPGVDFATDFEIPVFMTPASSREATEEQLRSEELATAIEPFVPTPESGVTVVPSQGGGMEFHLSRGPESAGSLPLVAFAVFWAGLVVLIIYAGAPLFFSAIFGAVDLLLLLIALFLSFGECRVIAESGRLSAQAILFGVRTGREIDCSTIAKIGVTGSAGAYSVNITQNDGRQLAVWWMLKRKQTADWLADEIRKAVASWRGRNEPDRKG
jgi:hypothetical protein